jgi:hypothetical protein
VERVGGGGRTVPTRWQGFVFGVKVRGLRVRRWLADRGSVVPCWPRERFSEAKWRADEEVRSALWVVADERERELELGKVENLRRACDFLDGTVVGAGGVFSFWRQMGRASRGRGFVKGRMLQGGCLVPAVGGGLCQLSNALYELALRSGCEVVERHAHSARLPNAPVHDATVAWNYVDLRFRVRERTRISVRMSAEELIVTMEHDPAVVRVLARLPEVAGSLPEARSCASCGRTECSRHEGARE